MEFFKDILPTTRLQHPSGEKSRNVLGGPREVSSPDAHGIGAIRESPKSRDHATALVIRVKCRTRRAWGLGSKAVMSVVPSSARPSDHCREDTLGLCTRDTIRRTSVPRSGSGRETCSTVAARTVPCTGSSTLFAACSDCRAVDSSGIKAEGESEWNNGNQIHPQLVNCPAIDRSYVPVMLCP